MRGSTRWNPGWWDLAFGGWWPFGWGARSPGQDCGRSTDCGGGADCGGGTDCGCGGACAHSRSCEPCEIPPPPWAPHFAGAGQSCVPPGGTAIVRVRVRNESSQARVVTLEVAPREIDRKSGITHGVTPATLALGPLQQGTALVQFTVPATARQGLAEGFVIWVRGCRQRYLDWSVTAVDVVCSAAHEVDVVECEDGVHHWYDHFYCRHACS